MRTWLFSIERSTFQVTPERLHYRHPVSPYLGENLRGVVKATYLRGQCVFADADFPGEPRGREWQREPEQRGVR